MTTTERPATPPPLPVDRPPTADGAPGSTLAPPTAPVDLLDGRVTSSTRRTASRHAPRRPVNARTPLTKKSLAKRGKLTTRPADAAAADRLLEMQRAASRARAALLTQASTFWVDRDEDDLADDRTESDLAVAIALRTTTPRAVRLLHDAHLAVDELPATFARLAQGDLPTEWFDRIIRNARELTVDQRSEFDEIIAEWNLSSIPADRFYDELRLLRSWYDAEGARRRPEVMRDVALECSPVDDGTACLRITGPVPEIHALAQRLDSAARAVQAQQRHALEDGAPIPFDIDGDVARDLSAMTLADLRYAVITRSVLDTGGVHVPAPAHRINVVVPVLTLMGLSDAPATYDGVVPLPADMARKLAAQEDVWYRVLTDPTRGEFLPLPADQYRPTTAMVEHLRLRDPVCAVPSCTRRTSSDAENDHIEEFDHAHPGRGGPTSIRNLHRLHWGHHDDKTRRLMDPERNEDGTTTWAIGTPARALLTTAPRRDLLTPVISTALAESWDRYQWLLELDALDRSGFIDQFLHEGGPEDPALDDAPPPPRTIGDPPF